MNLVQRVAEHLGAKPVGLNQATVVGKQDADRGILEYCIEFERGLLPWRDNRPTAHCCESLFAPVSSTRSNQDVSALPQPWPITAFNCCHTAAETGSGAPILRRLVHQQRVILVVQAGLDAGGEIPCRHASAENIQHARTGRTAQHRRADPGEIDARRLSPAAPLRRRPRSRRP